VARRSAEIIVGHGAPGRIDPGVRVYPRELVWPRPASRGNVQGVVPHVRDPRSPEAAPKRADLPPHLELATLQNGLGELRRAADRFETAVAGTKLDGARLTEANARLRGVEQALTSDAGLPRRPWFRHQIYAPGFYTGYGVKTIPGVREAIEQGFWDEANQQARRIAERLVVAAALIDAAAEALRSGR
jgi:N-acetylated-alpha-linked acidic dipeptidase